MPAAVERLRAYGLSLLWIGVVAYPAFLPAHSDGFPLSTYPMFSEPRSRVNDVVGAVAVGDGAERYLSPGYIANAEAMQAMVTLKKTLRAGRRASQALCRSIAERVAAAQDPELAGTHHVELVTERVDAIDYLAGRAKPEARRVHARCLVGAAK